MPMRWPRARSGRHNPARCRACLRSGGNPAGPGHGRLEFEEQVPDLDSLIVAVGGGGLIGGIAAWYASRIRIVGVEPEAAPTLTRALEAGCPVDAEAGGIAADSLGPEAGWRTHVPHRAGPREACLAGFRRCHPASAERALEGAESGRRAGRRGRLRGPALAALPAPARRTVGVLVCGGNTTAVDFG